jgi:hypothetical protein
MLPILLNSKFIFTAKYYPFINSYVHYSHLSPKLNWHRASSNQFGGLLKLQRLGINHVVQLTLEC